MEAEINGIVLNVDSQNGNYVIRNYVGITNALLGQQVRIHLTDGVYGVGTIRSVNGNSFYADQPQ